MHLGSGKTLEKTVNHLSSARDLQSPLVFKSWQIHCGAQYWLRDIIVVNWWFASMHVTKTVCFSKQHQKINRLWSRQK